MPIPRRNLNRYPNVPPEVVSLVNQYGSKIWKKEVSGPTLTVFLKLDHAPTDLMDALSQGVAYQVVDNQIYIWYRPISTFEGAGFYRLISYEILGYPKHRGYLENNVKFTLSAQPKL